jgi:hypothetical protein
MKAGRTNRAGLVTWLAAIVVAVLGSAPEARAQPAAEPSGSGWEEHIHTTAAASRPAAGDRASALGAEADPGLAGPWEVRGALGTAASWTSASGAGAGLEQTRIAPFAFSGPGAPSGATGTAVIGRAPDPGIKPTGVDLAGQRSTLEHGSFNLSNTGRSFGLDTWGCIPTSRFHF